MSDPVTPESNPYGSAPQANPYGAPQGNPYANAPGSGKAPLLSILAMASGVIGLLIGISGFGIIFAVAAVVLGHIGQRKEPHGRGFWLAGLITGYLGIVFNLAVIVFLFIFAGALFSLIPLTY
jgi:hypothetical protein